MPTHTTFTAEQLRTLMDGTTGWAECWDDVVYYLETVAESDTHLPPEVVSAVRDAVQRAKQHDVASSTDYRQVWEAVTGESAEDLPPAEVRYAPTNPIELEREYLSGLTFPTDRAGAYAYAQQRGAPWRVLQTVHQLPAEHYRSMAELLASLDEMAWNPRV